jgi:hypothetical protein
VTDNICSVVSCDFLNMNTQIIKTRVPHINNIEIFIPFSPFIVFNRRDDENKREVTSKKVILLWKEQGQRESISVTFRSKSSCLQQTVQRHYQKVCIVQKTPWLFKINYLFLHNAILLKGFRTFKTKKVFILRLLTNTFHAS